jgi:hypothetical protein
MRVLGILTCVGILSAAIARGSFGAGSWVWVLGALAVVPLAGYVPWILWLSRFRDEASFRRRERRVLEQLEHVDAEIEGGQRRLECIEEDLADGIGGGLPKERDQELRLLSEKERDVVELGQELEVLRLDWLDDQLAGFEILSAEGTLENAPALPRAILKTLDDQLARARDWCEEHEEEGEPSERWQATIDRLTTLRAAFTRGRERLRSVRRTRDRRAARTGAPPALDRPPHRLHAHTVLDAIDAQLDALPDLDSLDSDGSGVYVRVEVEGDAPAPETPVDDALAEASRPSGEHPLPT